jgi:general secretion pathway protein D
MAGRGIRARGRAAILLTLAALVFAGPAGLTRADDVEGEELVQLDFQDVELSVVIETIARLTNRNFIYDDRVRGRVTIVSPTRITVDQAYAVFESVLQVKGFTTVSGPGGAIKVIPLREAKESSIETSKSTRQPPFRDRYITRLIPLQYIDAEAITNTLKPLVSKDASMVAYAPTNTIILTDSSSNIRRILSILQSIDVETYREELAVIQVQYADATTLAEQLAEIYGAQTTSAPTPTRARARTRPARAAQAAAADPASRRPPRILTDPRTNSLIVLASRTRLEDIRSFVRRLDVPVTGEGRIHVYYLKHADSEEIANVLNSLISGAPQTAAGGAPGRAGQPPQALRAVVSELAEGVSVTADIGTNSLVIQGSREAYQTLAAVIDKLDLERPQVLVEALIMEVSVGNSQELGFNGIVRIFRNNTSYTIGSLTDQRINPSIFGPPGAVQPAVPVDPGDGEDGGTGPGITDNVDDFGDLIGNIAEAAANNFVAAATYNTVQIDRDSDGNPLAVSGTFIQGVIRASENLAGSNILSAPHILTSDNEEAEIKIGNNIPIITSRVQSAAGQDTGLATSQNIERRDVGVTLRVTPQITEGNSLRMEIYQEITDINPAVTAATGDPTEVGVSLSNRKIENTVVVSDGETVVIGGLVGDTYRDTVNKVPWLGDIPWLGWLFKSTVRELQKVNLLVFLTPYIIRQPQELEYQTIRKREEFERRSRAALGDPRKSEHQQDIDEEEFLDEYGIPIEKSGKRNPARDKIGELRERYPLERMKEIEGDLLRQEEDAAAEQEAQENAPRYSVVAGTYNDDQLAAERLTELLDAGFDGRLVAQQNGDAVRFEIRLGPFETREKALRAQQVVRDAFGMTPLVVVEPQQP